MSALLEEIAAGQGIYLSAAARRMPRYRLGKPVSLNCVLRWVKGGVRGMAGEYIRLEAARLFGKWVTTPAAISRFLQAQTPALAHHTAPQRTSKQRRRAAELAEQELERLGV
jgi:hypothetical protein